MTDQTTSKPKRHYAREPNKQAEKAATAKTQNTTTPPPTTKIAVVIDLLGRPEGATLKELTKTTGWQSHSARAVLTGLRKKGHTIAKSKRDDVSCYRIPASA